MSSSSFNTPLTTLTHTLSLHDALPIFEWMSDVIREAETKDRNNLLVTHIFITQFYEKFDLRTTMLVDRKSTRLNSSHVAISYAVFCLKKKNEKRRVMWAYDTSVTRTSV